MLSYIRLGTLGSVDVLKFSSIFFRLAMVVFHKNIFITDSGSKLISRVGKTGKLPFKTLVYIKNGTGIIFSLKHHRTLKRTC